jgi:hypothetical protein
MNNVGNLFGVSRSLQARFGRSCILPLAFVRNFVFNANLNQWGGFRKAKIFIGRDFPQKGKIGNSSTFWQIPDPQPLDNLSYFKYFTQRILHNSTAI